MEGKIPSITCLTTNSALTAVENKIPDVSSLVNKTYYNTKISEIEDKVNDHNHDKYITTPEFNILAARVFNARLAQADLITKINFDAKLKKKKNCERVASNKRKHLLVHNELKKLKTFVLIINIYIVYEVTKMNSIYSYPTLENCLFGAAKLTKILILISINILAMGSDLIDEKSFHLAMDLVKM